VDDRSTDATPAILARLAAEQPRLRVATVRELPAGWLGKNHANALGAGLARGELLLFTDADVLMHPSALARAVALLKRERLDHLAVAPRILMPGRCLAQFPLYFGLMFALFVRPWSVRNPRSRAHAGVGPFNLVRASAYRAAGGHAPIRLRPDDDLKLGKLLKKHGARQEFVSGVGVIDFPWYRSWRELRDGLEKNLYPGVGYRSLAVVAGAVAHVLGLALPPVAALVGSGPARWLGVVNWLAFGVVGALVARGFGTARWAGLLLPAYAVAGAWFMLRSATLAIARGGIDWRGTRYPWRALRENVV
jgi:glycosyltransferase involved in cell wall biosynthesis